MRDKHITISGSTYLIASICLLLIPLPWASAVILSAAVHEAGHYLAMWILSRQTAAISICSHSAKIYLPAMERWQECICALCGPLAGLCLFLTARWLPRVAICALVQTAYNLLPIYPLDGGRVLQCILSGLLDPPCVNIICKTVSVIFIMAILLCTLYISHQYHLGPLPLLAAIFTLFHIK